MGGGAVDSRGQGFVAEARRSVAAPPEIAFDRLADHASWRAWMPRSFRPVGPPLGRLRVGDRPRVRIAGALVPTPIEVFVVERAREIGWRGGIRPLLYAEHRFLFDAADGGGTVVRSVETWSGALAPVARRLVQPVAERIGREQLDALARAVETK
ncbi:MAG TPA: SRPBCC family protein [Minicystis sp.]|nr:SRPBCC family protein [Minicystis sp.]